MIADVVVVVVVWFLKVKAIGIRAGWAPKVEWRRREIWSKFFDARQFSFFFPPPWHKPEAAHKTNILEHEIRTRIRWYVFADVSKEYKILTSSRCY
jgi:hypothetical protein